MALPEVERFRALWAEKTAEKDVAMTAYQRMRLARKEGRDSDAKADEAEGDEHGWVGREGALYREAEQLCIDLVRDHPEYFALFEDKTQEQIVLLVDAFRAAGLKDDEDLATMYELGKWERQHVGGAVKARVRLPGGRV